MKPILRSILIAVLIAFGIATASAQSTAFTYQGRLNDGANFASGVFDFEVKLYGYLSGGLPLGTATTNGVGVTNGYFLLTLNFGGGSFNWGADRFLEISVRTNGGGSFQLLSPRQPVAPAPKSLVADYAASVPPAPSFTSPTFTGTPAFSNPLAAISTNQPFTVNSTNKVALLNADLLDGLDSTHFARLTASQTFTGSNAFLGGAQLADGTGVNGSGALIRVGLNSSSPNNPKKFLFGDGSYVSVGEGLIDDSMELNAGSFVMQKSPSSIGSGFVGIGVTNPATMLHVGGAVTASSFLGNGAALTNVNASALGGLGTNAFVRRSGDSMTGDLSFGAQARQMLNLFNSDYALGVQTDTLYLRSFNDFSWFRRGVHSDSAHTPGAGGTELMRLSSGGALTLSGSFNSSYFSGQALNLFQNGIVQHGMGVQTSDNTLYSRAESRFAWYRGGSHATTGPGSGGSELMSLQSSGLSLNTGLSINGSGISITNASDPSLRTTITPGGIVFTDQSIDAKFMLANGELTLTNARLNVESYVSTFALDTGHIDAYEVWATWQLRAQQVVVNDAYANTFHETSDRNKKQNISAVDPGAVLDKLASLPVYSWEFTNAPGIKHVGPMAQDFKAAFDLGHDDKTIATVDAHGVALTAIQGLNEKLEAQNAALIQKNEMLEQRLVELEKLVQRLSQ